MCDPLLLLHFFKCGLKLNVKIFNNLRWISVHVHVHVHVLKLKNDDGTKSMLTEFLLANILTQPNSVICLVLDSLCFANCRYKPITNIALVWGSNVKYICSFWENYYKKTFETFLWSSQFCIIIFSNTNYLLIVIDDYPVVKLYLQKHIKVRGRVCLPFTPTPQCSGYIHIMVAVVQLRDNPCIRDPVI